MVCAMVAPGNLCARNINASYERGNLHPYHRMNSDGDKTKTNKKKLPDTLATYEDNPNLTSLETYDFSYLHFSVENYYDQNDIEITDLPENDQSYLRFDINRFMEQNPKSLDEMPALDNEFDYLKFRVEKFMQTDLGNETTLGELPEEE